MNRKIRVVIVDDSLLIRRILRELLTADPMIEVVGEAGDAFEAREKIKEVNPDVITLDVEMPKMSGIDFLERIMKLRPMPVVMISTLTKAGADITIRALELGAVDAIAKPTTNQAEELTRISETLIAKIKAAASSKPRLSARILESVPPPVLSHTPKSSKGKKLIAIGASTGGVEAIRVVLSQLPESTPPIIVSQHMPDSFIPSFTSRMDQHCKINVLAAEEGLVLQKGHAYIAQGGAHLGIKRKGNEYACHLIQGDLVSGHRPSVDAMFTSVAEVAGVEALGVILTGMGADGARGMKLMRDKGAYTIGQNEASCVVYGMPKMAHKLGGVCEELPLSSISEAILSHC